MMATYGYGCRDIGPDIIMNGFMGIMNALASSIANTPVSITTIIITITMIMTTIMITTTIITRIEGRSFPKI